MSSDFLRDWRNTRISMHQRIEIADKLDEQRDRIAELEAENAELEQDSADAREVLANQWAWVEDRDALAFALSKVREWHNDIHARAIRQSDIDNLHRLLDAVPTDLLREHDAEREAELEEESGRANDEHLNYMRSDRGRAEFAAVIEKAREYARTQDYYYYHPGAVRVVDAHPLEVILEAVPADLLREHDADVWDAAFADGRRQDAEGDDGPRFVNPYRVKPEDESPKRVLLTHPHDGHGPDDTCMDCEKPEDER